MIKKFFLGTFGLCINVLIYAVIILFAIRLITFSYDFSYEVFGDTVMVENSEEIVPVQIAEGASTSEVAGLLEKNGLIKYKHAFVFRTAFSQYKGMIQPGNYELSPSMNMEEMLAVISGHPEDLE